QIAHPESIKQGCHESCAAANMEELMARNHPDKYADMVSQLATQGEYKFPPPSDKTVKAETHGDKLDPKSDSFGQRSYTSELFQDAAIQLAVQPKEYKSIRPGSPELEPRPKGVSPSSDSGERLIDPKNPGSPEKFSGLDTEKQLKAYKTLFPDEKYGEYKPVNTPKDLEAALKANGGPPMKVAIGLGNEKFSGMSSGDAGTDA